MRGLTQEDAIAAAPRGGRKKGSGEVRGRAAGIGR